MALETPVTNIYDLVATNPTGGDPKSQGDDHIRNIKAALQASFECLNVGTEGYQKIGGIILQWGRADMGVGTTAAVTWPLAFPTNCLSVQATDLGGSVSIGTVGIPTTSGVTFSASTTPGLFNWLAVGH